MTKIMAVVGLYLLGLTILYNTMPGAQKSDDYKKAEALYAQTPNPPPR